MSTAMIKRVRVGARPVAKLPTMRAPTPKRASQMSLPTGVRVWRSHLLTVGRRTPMRMRLTINVTDETRPACTGQLNSTEQICSGRKHTSPQV